MFLRNVRIENFRGIARLEIGLGRTTVLAGENASGKSRFLDALQMLLGYGQTGSRVAFEARDFMSDAASPGQWNGEVLRVVLEVGEVRTGQWDRELRQALQGSVVMEHGAAVLRLEVTAEPGGGEPGGEEGSTVKFRCLDGAGRALLRGDGALALGLLRERMPFVATGGAQNAAQAAVTAEAGEEDLAEFCVRRMDELTAAEFVQCQQVSDHIMDDVRRSLLERGAPDIGRARVPGAGAQSLAPLLFLGGMMRRGVRKTFHPLAVPLMGVMEIEAHLHPSVLSSVWQIVQALPVQKVVTTYSGELLSMIDLRDLRKLERRDGEVHVYQIREEDLAADEHRRVWYHIRARRGASLFSRTWLLVEGETEAWLLPEMARALGYDLSSEGVYCIEFAQAGLTALVRAANALGIEWHLLTDGDRAGENYVNAARAHMGRRPESECITQLEERDMEEHLWGAGYEDVFLLAARKRKTPGVPLRAEEARRVIDKALENHAKPTLAIHVIDAMARPNSAGVPRVLARCIETVVRLARSQDNFTPVAG
jgi:putative ATP-dependent endonuclease of OLD family